MPDAPAAPPSPPVSRARRLFRRLAAITLVALALLPNPLATTRFPVRNMSQTITAHAIALDPERPGLHHIGQLRLIEAWALDSANTGFGGYSALALLGDRQLLLASDTGMLAGFTITPRGGGITHEFIAPPPSGPGKSNYKTERDLEAMAIDRARGRTWTAYEHSNQIWRFSRGLARAEGHVAPAAMRHWNPNGGPEAMARLADGRFLVMAETTGGPGGGTAALLFPTDPVEAPDVAPLSFAYDSGDMGRVTDAAQLPDGRILLLHRRLSLTQGFVSTLAIADPATIRAGAMWRGAPIATFVPPLITENFEGIAVEDSPAGAVIWMISDDNLARWQRTLLLKLLLPRGEAPEAATPGFTGER